MPIAFRASLPVLILAAAVFADDAAPAGVDLSTPKAAFATYTSGLMQGDHDKVAKAVIATDKGQKMLDGQIAYNVVEARFRAATIKAFPDAAKELPEPFADALAAIDSADVKIDGDTATLTTKQTMQPVKLKKLADGWKVDLSSMYSDSVVDEVLQFRKALTDVMEAMTDDVGHGKFTDYNDVRSNLETRLKMRLAMPPADEATTKP